MQRGAVQGERGRYRRLGGVTASFIRRSQEVHAVLAERLVRPGGRAEGWGCGATKQRRPVTSAERGIHQRVLCCSSGRKPLFTQHLCTSCALLMAALIRTCIRLIEHRLACVALRVCDCACVCASWWTLCRMSATTCTAALLTQEYVSPSLSRLNSGWNEEPVTECRSMPAPSRQKCSPRR